MPECVSLHQFGKRGLFFHQMAAHEPLIGLVQLGAQQALETSDVATMRGNSDDVPVNHLAPRLV
jgi:hypothetical protein